jgi:hypothetical protein
MKLVIKIAAPEVVCTAIKLCETEEVLTSTNDIIDLKTIGKAINSDKSSTWVAHETLNDASKTSVRAQLGAIVEE